MLGVKKELVRHSLVLVRAIFWIADIGLLCVFTWWNGGRGKRTLWASFIRAFIPFIRAPLSWLNHLPKALRPNTLGG